MLQSSATKSVVPLCIIATPLCATDLRVVIPQLSGKELHAQYDPTELDLKMLQVLRSTGSLVS